MIGKFNEKQLLQVKNNCESLGVNWDNLNNEKIELLYNVIPKLKNSYIEKDFTKKCKCRECGGVYTNSYISAFFTCPVVNCNGILDNLK